MGQERRRKKKLWDFNLQLTWFCGCREMSRNLFVFSQVSLSLLAFFLEPQDIPLVGRARWCSSMQQPRGWSRVKWFTARDARVEWIELAASSTSPNIVKFRGTFAVSRVSVRAYMQGRFVSVKVRSNVQERGACATLVFSFVWNFLRSDELSERAKRKRERERNVDRNKSRKSWARSDKRKEILSGGRLSLGREKKKDCRAQHTHCAARTA